MLWVSMWRFVFVLEKNCQWVFLLLHVLTVKPLGAFVLASISKKTCIVNNVLTCIVKDKMYSSRKEVDFLSNVISEYVPQRQHVVCLFTVQCKTLLFLKFEVHPKPLYIQYLLGHYTLSEDLQDLMWSRCWFNVRIKVFYI